MKHVYGIQSRNRSVHNFDLSEPKFRFFDNPELFLFKSETLPFFFYARFDFSVHLFSDQFVLDLMLICLYCGGCFFVTLGKIFCEQCEEWVFPALLRIWFALKF